MTRNEAPRRRALLTGITGQDGSYLTELLLGKGYEVHGVIRRSSSFNTSRIDHLFRDPHDPEARVFLHYGDLTDGASLRQVMDRVQPDEIYHLGAQSHVKVSFDQPEYTVETIVLGTLRLLEALRSLQHTSGRRIKYYQASSSEMYGLAKEVPQTESTPFNPRSPYGAAKVYAYWQTLNYREAYDLFAVNGTLFNHESPRRGETFVTRKITRAATRIKLGLQKKLFLGNLEARRDWGFAGDYVEAMWLMLQQDEPDDYIIATGQCHPVKDFLERVFERLSLDWRACVESDPRYFRPTEADFLVGDATKARRKLGWEPKVSFDQLVDMMVEHDLELARREKMLVEAGYAVGTSDGFV